MSLTVLVANLESGPPQCEEDKIKEAKAGK